MTLPYATSATKGHTDAPSARQEDMDTMTQASPIKAGGDSYDREGSLALRNEVISLRDAALEQNSMEWAVKLSHVIAWMAVTIDERWQQ